MRQAIRVGLLVTSRLRIYEEIPFTEIHARKTLNEAVNYTPDVGMRVPRPAMTADRFGGRRVNTGFTIRFAKIEVAPIAVSPRTAARRPPCPPTVPSTPAIRIDSAE
jgi:hypothetical protein